MNSLTNIFCQVPLRQILVIPFVLQIFAAVGLTGWLAISNGQRAVHDLVARLQNQAWIQIAHHLDDKLVLPAKINQINLAAINLGLLDLTDFQTTGRYFWQQMRSFGVGYINYANTQGEFIGVERLDNGNLLVNERSYRSTQGQLYVYTTNRQGDRARHLETKAYNPLSEAWYTDAVKAGKPTWSDIYQWDDKPEILSISSSYPVYDRHRKLLGVIGVDLILSQINDFLQHLQVTPSSQTLILERNGFLVASSSRTPPFQPVKGKAQRLQAIESQDPLIRGTAQYLRQRFSNLNAIQTTQRFSFEVDRKRQLVFVAPWNDEFGLDWLIVVVIPESDFMAQINANTRTTVLLCLLALTVAILVGLLTARLITRPIQRLINASQAIADGDLDQAIDVQGVSELKILSQAFSGMATKLKQSFTTLESRVQERTADLAVAKETAEVASRVKSKFLASMSHELRTPLNSILGFSQVLHQDPSLTVEQQELVRTIHRNGESLLCLINHILAVSKIGVDPKNSCDFLPQPELPTTESSVASDLIFDLAQMPEPWRLELMQAAIKGFDQQILQLVEQIPPEAAALAEALTTWSNQFQFTKILNLIQQVPQ